MIEKDPGRVKETEAAVFIQCVGSRNDERPYCSRVCCSHSVKDALKLKGLRPDMDVYVLYRDMRTYGFKEDFYRKASDEGVVFIRYQPEDPPDIAAVEEEGKSFLRLTVTEPVLGRKIQTRRRHRLPGRGHRRAGRKPGALADAQGPGERGRLFP